MSPNTMLYVSNLEIAIGTTLAFSQGFTVIIKQSQTIKTDYQFLSHWFLILWAGSSLHIAAYNKLFNNVKVAQRQDNPYIHIVNQKTILVPRYYTLYTESFRQQKGSHFQLILFSLHAPKHWLHVMQSSFKNLTS